IDYREYRALIPYIYGVVVVLLIAVFFFPERNGAQRWIELGPFDLQPAEVAKIVVVLGLASILSPQNRDDVRPDLTWSKIGLVILTVALPAGLIYQQPDLGTMLVFVFVMMAMLFAAGASWRQLLTLGGAGTAITVVLFRIGAIADYQLNRIRVLVDPTVDPPGIGYNLAQSQLAIGSGRRVGGGRFKGTHTNFHY